MGTPDPTLAPFERLIKLLEHELTLAGGGRLDDLQAAVLARGEYLERLPDPVPDGADALLLRARALHSRVTIETERLAADITARRQARRRARVMSRTYVPAPSTTTYSTSA